MRRSPLVNELLKKISFKYSVHNVAGYFTNEANRKIIIIFKKIFDYIFFQFILFIGIHDISKNNIVFELHIFIVGNLNLLLCKKNYCKTQKLIQYFVNLNIIRVKKYT